MRSSTMEVAIETAEEAGRHSLASFHRIGSTTFKEGKEIVTNVDRECEEIIKAALLEPFPDYGFLGEESGQEESDSDYTWIVDPLDGTTNYARGIKLWGFRSL